MPSPRKRLYGKALAAFVLLLSATAFVGLPPARAGEQTATTQVQVDEAIQQILALTNEERAKAGLPALTLDPALCASALAHGQDMADHDFFSHTGSDGSTVDERIEAAGYDPLWAYGENIAAGQATPEEAVEAWMNSEGHRANILSPYYDQIGVSFVYRPDTTYVYYWTQDFASHTELVVQPPPEPPAPTPAPPQPTPAPPTVVPVRPSPVAPASAGVPLQPTAGANGAPGAGEPTARAAVGLERARQVVELLNRARTGAGEAEFAFDPALVRAAQAHSADMAHRDRFSDIGADGSTAGQRAAEAGLGPTSGVAELIAAGQPTAEEVTGAWLADESVRGRILDPTLRLAGVGYAYSGSAAYRHYWTLTLAGRGPAPGTLVSPAWSGRTAGLGQCLPGLPRWLIFSRVR